MCALAMVVAGMAVPTTLASLDRARGWGAARYIAARMLDARARAVARAAAVALRFDGDDAATTVSAFADGNHNGVLSRDIDAGADPRLSGPDLLSSLFAGVSTSLVPGTSRLFSFSPEGTATSGTVYLTTRDGARFAVRVLGATARIRVLRYLPRTDAWVESY